MNDGRVGRQFCRGSGLTISGDRTIDQFRIELSQRAVIQLQSPHHAGAKILDQDISARDKPADDFDRVRRFQIENETFLADIELAERGGEAVADGRTSSHGLAVDRLYLDDLRPMSASIRVQCGPAMVVEKSSTRRPAKLFVKSPHRCRLSSS
jgi:hypothetical protein